MSEFKAVSRGLRRLLQLRKLEEEQCRLSLEAALTELRRLEHALDAAAERSRRGRMLIHLAARTGELPDRIAGIEEGRFALHHAVMLEAAIGKSRQTADLLRERFQAARVVRRQVETLVQEAEAAQALDASRRNQQALDDWYGSRRQASEAAKGQSHCEEEP